MGIFRMNLSVKWKKTNECNFVLHMNIQSFFLWLRLKIKNLETLAENANWDGADRQGYETRKGFSYLSFLT